MLKAIIGTNEHLINQYIEKLNDKNKIQKIYYGRLSHFYNFLKSIFIEELFDNIPCNQSIFYYCFNLKDTNDSDEKNNYEIEINWIIKQYCGSLNGLSDHLDKLGINIYIHYPVLNKGEFAKKIIKSSISKEEIKEFDINHFKNDLYLYINKDAEIITEDTLDYFIKFIKDYYKLSFNKCLLFDFYKFYKNIIDNILLDNKGKIEKKDVYSLFGLINQNKLGNYFFNNFNKDNLEFLYNVNLISIFNKCNKIINYVTGYTNYNTISINNKIGQNAKKFIIKKGNSLQLNKKIIEMNNEIIRYYLIKYKIILANNHKFFTSNNKKWEKDVEKLLDRNFIYSLYFNLHK